MIRLGSGHAAFVAVLVFGTALSAAATAMPVSRIGVGTAPVRVQRSMATGGASVVAHLHHIVTIGSTVDPINGDQNPYGLAVAPVTSGKMTAGDLVISNFNDGANNVQGLGTTIEVLHPIPGSKPQRLIQDSRLTGSDAISLGPDDDEPWIASFTANDNPVLDSSGNLTLDLAGTPFAQPWGQAFSGMRVPHGVSAFYESNSNDGSIVRIAINKKDVYKPEVIATGFSVNHGVPGTVLAPSGLTYDPNIDTLYIVDGNVNRVVAFRNVSMIPTHGIVVSGDRFGGVAGSLARVVARGAPLAAPISAALLFNGNLVVGNTTNNVLVEINPATRQVVHTKNLDRGAIGALFGIAAIGSDVSSTRIYFNDDNDNTVKVLEP